ncbi:hypothetical protein CUMW_151610 [Citrus unshiu]|nr:hypothetical protein CUMW_151610 [Citrus unshiu]
MQGHKVIRSWTYVPRSAGLHHCGRSCRRRWAHYLSPDIKHDKITEEEEELITKLNSSAGKRELPGGTDSDIRNYWKTVIKKKLVSQNGNHFSPQKINKPTADNQTNSSTVKHSKLNLKLTLTPPCQRQVSCSYSSLGLQTKQCCCNKCNKG